MFPKISLFALLVITSTVFTSILNADEDDIHLGGYLKNIVLVGKTFFDEQYYLSTHRFRTQAHYFPSPSLEFRVELDNELQWGDFLKTRQYTRSREFADLSYLDMTLNPVENDSANWKIKTHRMYLRYNDEKVDFTLGRQRIAWGTGRIWNPTDLFNPNSPLSVEPGEKRGSDAVRINYRPSDSLSVEAAWAIGIDETDIRYALRGKTSISSYEFSLMAGRFRDDKVIGLDYSGYLGDSGFRGEFTYTWEQDRDYLRGVLSFQHMLSSGVDILLEYLYNGGNVSNFDLQSLNDFVSYDAITTVNSHFLATRLSKQFHPLVSGSLLGIVDIEDKSFFVFPMVTYSLREDMDVLLGAQFFGGDKGDYSFYHHSVIASLEIYF